MPIIHGRHFIYSVRPGDTLYSIATRLESDVPSIVGANALYPPIVEPNMIFPGQVLIVSTQGLHQVHHIVSPGDTLNQYAQRYVTSADLIEGINPQIVTPDFIYVNQALLVPAVIYEVEQGDTLNQIAQRFGLSLSSLIEANRERPGISPDLIYPGYRLIIPLPSSVNIVVFRPFPGTVIREGQRLEGFARAFEAVILYRLIDDTGQIVTNETPIQTTAAAPIYGSFSTEITFDQQPSTDTGELWVYTRSARDGSIQDLVQLNVRFSF